MSRGMYLWPGSAWEPTIPARLDSSAFMAVVNSVNCFAVM